MQPLIYIEYIEYINIILLPVWIGKLRIVLTTFDNGVIRCFSL